MPKYSDRAQTLIKLVRQNGWRTGVEVGVWQGETSRALLESCVDMRLWLVDHWRAQPLIKQNKVTGDAHYSDQIALDKAKAQVLNLSNEYQGWVQIIEAPSVEAAYIVPPGSVDFVFIDADHKTQSVLDDFLAWRPCVRDGGAMIGHDADWPSVRMALEMLNGGAELHPGNVWMIKV